MSISSTLDAPSPRPSFISRFGWLFTAIAALVGGEILLIIQGSERSDALIVLVVSLVIGLITRFVPLRIPAGNPLQNQPLPAVLKSLRPILGYAILFPVLLIPVVLWQEKQTLYVLPLLSHNWILSWNYDVVGKMLLLGIPALILAVRYGGSGKQLGLTHITPPMRWIGASVTAVLLIAFQSLSVVGQSQRGVSIDDVAVLALISFAGAGVPEELLYRILLQTRLEVVLGRWNGLAVTTVLFALLHWPSRFAFQWQGQTGSPILDLFLALASVIALQGTIGFVLGYMWMRYRNAWLNIAAHTIFDLLGLLAIVMVR